MCLRTLLESPKSWSRRTMRRSLITLAAVIFAGVAFSFAATPSAQANSSDADLKGAFRRTQTNGWTFVHLQGTPHQIGFQNGFLLAPEIEDALKVVALETTHDNNKEWQFFRDAAQNRSEERRVGKECRSRWSPPH